jgi:two-component system chemotaxis sensor kinase CheA
VKQYFEQFVGVRLEVEETFALHPCEKPPLKKVTAFVTLKGAVEGMFVVTVDEPLSRAIVRGIVLDPLTAEEEGHLVEDSLAETANTILGNSFAMFRQFADFVLMESPITIETDGASIKYADADIWACALHSGHGAMEIGFVLTKRGY